MSLTGDKQLDSQLRLLGDKVSRRVARSGLSAGLVVIAKRIRSLAPVGDRKRRKAKGLQGKPIKQAIGQRIKKNRKTKVQEAKAGLNVAKKGAKRAPHWALANVGTKKRTTKSGANRGKSPANRFINRAYSESKGAALIAVRGRIVTRIKAEEAKL